jgi:thioredoxin reductase
LVTNLTLPFSKIYITLDETGYIVNVPGTSKTNVPGVFVVVMLLIMFTVKP